MFPLVIAGWLFTAVALVTDKSWPLLAGAPFFLVAGVLVLLSATAWARLARQATAGGLYGERYRERVANSHFLRLTMGACLVIFGVAWVAAGTLL